MAAGKAKTAGVLATLSMLIGAAYYLSLPAYPKVSPQAYRCATALYTVCNQQSENKLPVLDRLIGQSFESGELTDQEAEWLRSIIDRAQQGEWQAATVECRKLLECQVDRDARLVHT